ncbi:MAG: tetratricopeptide repeat protein [Chloroflexi bacterium]|nr:tetratricopeptide repeat protein [Chloroflexota bacterium]
MDEFADAASHLEYFVDRDDLKRLVAQLLLQPAGDGLPVVAIDGQGGQGKTTILDFLEERLCKALAIPSVRLDFNREFASSGDIVFHLAARLIEQYAFSFPRLSAAWRIYREAQGEASVPPLPAPEPFLLLRILTLPLRVALNVALYLVGSREIWEVLKGEQWLEMAGRALMKLAGKRPVVETWFQQHYHLDARWRERLRDRAREHPTRFVEEVMPAAFAADLAPALRTPRRRPARQHRTSAADLAGALGIPVADLSVASDLPVTPRALVLLDAYEKLQGRRNGQEVFIRKLARALVAPQHPPEPRQPRWRFGRQRPADQAVAVPALVIVAGRIPLDGAGSGGFGVQGQTSWLAAPDERRFWEEPVTVAAPGAPATRRLHCVNLDGLILADAQDYLRRKFAARPLDERLETQLVTLKMDAQHQTCPPLHLALIATIVENIRKNAGREPTLQDFQSDQYIDVDLEKQLLDRMLLCDTPAERILTYAAAQMRWFSAPLMRHFPADLVGFNVGTFETLCGYDFVYRHRSRVPEKTYRLHDMVRELVLDVLPAHLPNTAPEFIAGIHRAAAQYFREQATQAQDDDIRFEYVVEYLYHSFCLREDLETVWQELSRTFSTSLDRFQFGRCSALLEATIGVKRTSLLQGQAALQRRADLYQAKLLFAQDRWDECREVLDHLAEHAPADEEDPDFAFDRYLLQGVLLKNMDYWPEALATFERALRLVQREEDPYRWGCLMNNVASVWYDIGQRRQAIAGFREAAATLQGAGHALEAAFALNNLVIGYDDTGMYEQSDAAFQEALALLRGEFGEREHLGQSPEQSHRARLLLNHGGSLLERLRCDDAIRMFEDAEKIFRAHAFLRGRCYTIASRGDAYLLRARAALRTGQRAAVTADLEHARRALQEAQVLAHEHLKERWAEACIGNAWGIWHLTRWALTNDAADLAPAEAALRAALEHTEAIGDPEGSARIAVNLAYVALGRRQVGPEVASTLQQAVATFRSLGYRLNTAKALLALAEVAQEQGRGEEAAPYRDHAAQEAPDQGNLLAEPLVHAPLVLLQEIQIKPLPVVQYSRA